MEPEPLTQLEDAVRHLLSKKYPREVADAVIIKCASGRRIVHSVPDEIGSPAGAVTVHATMTPAEPSQPCDDAPHTKEAIMHAILATERRLRGKEVLKKLQAIYPKEPWEERSVLTECNNLARDGKLENVQQDLDDGFGIGYGPPHWKKRTEDGQ